ncbi:hypothetical protein PYW08_015727 [Mythimna loreyi]|uniref:Uncharacterized protein n=4 Tax=Mythimna loreyi TaxID=667449 RepID=A0ACC2QRG9_9NEOP|nr:hypothetical protein PYW08_011213 [Mythimna loreyi]KAJ8707456.1 hypothetical protein PYW08_010708 [Mythimna loreyi]KAJ8723196.1 hypothetical protein PYW08_003108 [Mythimna loreyi]KAJ8724253.1 hypothetical protein PYW08_015727 [Mythimna loreyi]
METEAFNTELLIDEIEKRPAIWDMTSSDYSDKNLRRRAWEELVLIFCEGHLRLLLCRFCRLYKITDKTVSTSIFDKCRTQTGRNNARLTPDKRAPCEHYTKIQRAFNAR